MPSFLRIAAVLLLLALDAQAGMTMITIREAAATRLEVLSFFIVGYLLFGLAVKALWNSLTGTFPKLPRIDYKRALALLMVSGLFFYVVLTMISGARELLTPGAWEKQGVGYRLRGNEPMDEKALRRKKIELLKIAVWEYTEQHGGKIPDSQFTDQISPSLWQTLEGDYYCYLPVEPIGGGRQILIYEPSSSGARRFVVLTDGTIEDRAEGDLKRELGQPRK